MWASSWRWSRIQHSPGGAEGFSMKAPAFQFYPDDFLGGVADMTQAEVGAYILLLCSQWGRGEIPGDPERLALVAKGPVSPFVLTKFPAGKNGRMEEVRARQEAFRKACSDAGKRGGGNPKLKSKGTFKPPLKVNTKVPINSPSPTPSPSPATNSNTSIPGAVAPKGRNVLLDAVAAIGGADPAQTPKGRWSAIQKVLGDMRSATPDLTPEEIRRRERHYMLLFPTTRATPEALAKWWAQCDKRPPTLHQNPAPTEDEHAQGF